LTIVSAMLPMFAGILYVALPMTRAMVSEPPNQVVRERRADPVLAEVMPIGGFTETPIARASGPRRRHTNHLVALPAAVVADGNEIIGRTMEQGETVPIDLGDELLLWATTPRRCSSASTARPGAARRTGRRPVDPHRPRRLPRLPGTILTWQRAQHADAGFFPAR
jgi:hypothetical protein